MHDHQASVISKTVSQTQRSEPVISSVRAKSGVGEQRKTKKQPTLLNSANLRALKGNVRIRGKSQREVHGRGWVADGLASISLAT
jgi:hypothetical protein